MQILTFKSHLWCSSSNAILPTVTCKTQSDSQDSTAAQLPFEKPWCSHSTATCAVWIAQHIRIATHYCRTHRFDAPVPMHKMSQHMQNTIAQHPQRREKVTWDPQEQDSTAKRRRLRPSRARVNFSPQRNLRWPKKTQCFVQIVTLRSHPWCSSSTTKHDQNRKTRLQNKHHSSLGATIPLRSAQTELHSRIELQHSTVNNIALHPFQCTKCLSTRKKQ